MTAAHYLHERTRGNSTPQLRLAVVDVLGEFTDGSGERLGGLLRDQVPDDGQVIAFEIKAGTRVSGEDLRGLRLLKDRLGPRLQEAVILYSGQYAYRYEVISPKLDRTSSL